MTQVMNRVWYSLLLLLFVDITSGIGGTGGPTQFWLYTALGERQLLDPFANVSSDASKSYFDPCNVTIVLITGLNQPRSDPRLVNFANDVAQDYFNVIIVDYDNRDYIKSVIYGGRDIAFMLEWLVKTHGADRNQVVLIGISMGAHTAGVASSSYRVGRIIGCDPSGPVYDALPETRRLDKGDADFVQIIHSSSVIDGGSALRNTGHVNYIINNGLSQPGCNGDAFCNHVRSAFMLEASFTSCHFVFRKCFAYWAFVLGLCDSSPTLNFGINLDPATAPRDSSQYFYSTTRQEFPYCSKAEEGEVSFTTTFC